MEIELVRYFFRKLLSSPEQSTDRHKIDQGNQHKSTDAAAAHASEPSFKLREKVRALHAYMLENSRKQQSAPVLTGRASVIDGHTISIGSKQIRLFGVDAPKLTHPHGQKAKETLTKLVKGQVIRAEVANQGSNGRVVARCYLPDGSDLSAEMVEIGLALDLHNYSGVAYRHLERKNIRGQFWLTEAHQNGDVDLWEKLETKLSRKLK